MKEGVYTKLAQELASHMARAVGLDPGAEWSFSAFLVPVPGEELRDVALYSNEVARPTLSEPQRLAIIAHVANMLARPSTATRETDRPGRLEAAGELLKKAAETAMLWADEERKVERQQRENRN